ncbi:ABC transporter ATP-binding protein [Caproiciproducens sp. CPB-2]|uniref:ABC transporter ATP-binding protein n=1 Tax=Caproiciproducens sp. CPB-2 TaxID=3030017 RepID=UPI0023DC7988|nr:ABC transporter ATP-binding protein [Caproiciproducens sp. CPB-2]MDF1494832.1 ABC transporter ATP-binding protein [Caproiciproducens sp. CPB-2]
MKHEKSLGAVLRRVVAASTATSVLTVFVIVLAVVTALFPPLVLERVVNDLTAGRVIALSLALSYLGFIALSGLLESGQNVMITVFGQKVTHGLRSALCAKLHRLPAAYFTSHEAGKIASRFVNDVDTVDSLFTDGIVSMFADGCKVVSILIVIFYKSTGLGFLMLLVTPLLFAMTRLFQKRMLKAQLENRVAVSKVNNHIPETIRNIRMIHVLLREKYMEQRYDDYIGESYRATDKSNLYDSIYSPIVIFVSSCVIAVMMVCAAMGGGIRTFFGISVGTAVAVIAYVGQVFAPLESLGMEIQNIQSAVAGVKRINEVLAEAEREVPDDSNTGKSSEAAPIVCFDHVRFGYGDDSDVLQDLSFTVSKGEAVTFVGRTGAGKSTVFRLLLGLYRPLEGRVLIKGSRASAIPDEKKRRLIGYVEQSFHLVEGTVAEQISLFDPAVARKQVENAARLVGLHESILALPDGYDTPASEAAFSQGQFQLLSIARAVAASPEILLLDEITANLDSNTEQRVLDALERAAKGRTVLSISHRLQERVNGQRIIRVGGQS